MIFKKNILIYICLSVSIIFSSDNKNNNKKIPPINSAKKNLKNKKNSQTKNPIKKNTGKQKNLNKKNNDTTKPMVETIQEQINITNKKIEQIKQKAQDEFNVEMKIDEDLTAKIEKATDDITKEISITNKITLSAQWVLKQCIKLVIINIVLSVGLRFIGATIGSKNLKETMANFSSSNDVKNELIKNGLTITLNTLSELKESFYNVIEKAKNTVIEKLTNSYPVNSDNIELLLQNKNFIESHSNDYIIDHLTALKNTLEYLEKNQKALPVKMTNFQNNNVFFEDDLLLHVYLNPNPLTSLDITQFKFDGTYETAIYIEELRKMNLIIGGEIDIKTLQGQQFKETLANNGLLMKNGVINEKKLKTEQYKDFLIDEGLIIGGKIDSHALLKNLKTSGLIKDSVDQTKLLSLEERIKNLTPKGDKIYNYNNVLIALQEKEKLISTLKKDKIIADDGKYFHPSTIEKYFDLKTMPENHPGVINEEHEIKFTDTFKQKIKPKKFINALEKK